MKRLGSAFVTSVALVAAGCGATSNDATSPTTTTVPPPAPTMALTVFAVADGLLRPRVVHVPETPAVASAALAALGVDAKVTIAGGTATVDLANAPSSRIAEIVYTLTQFASVERIDVAGRSGLTRDDFAAFVPPILVERPAEGADVPATVRVSGTASVFEATLVVQIVRGDKVLDRQSVTASEGAPGRGTFAATLQASPGKATVQAFSPSAADGSPQHEADVDVTVTP